MQFIIGVFFIQTDTYINLNEDFFISKSSLAVKISFV